MTRVMDARKSIVANKSQGAIDFRISKQDGSLRYIQGAECVVLMKSRNPFEF